MSISEERSSIEVNGIRFETVIPNPTIVMPNNYSQSRIRFEIELRLTNLAGTPQRVQLYNTHPEFLDVQRSPIDKALGDNNWNADPDDTYRLLKPRKSIVVIKQILFYWIGNEIAAEFDEESGDTWNYFHFNIGQSFVQFFSDNHFKNDEIEWCKFNKGDIAFPQTIRTWVGEALTPPAAFQIVTS